MDCRFKSFYLFISLNLKSVTFHYFDYLIQLATGETASACDPVVQNLEGGGTFRIIWIAGKFRHYMHRRSPRRHVHDPLFVLLENVLLILFIQN